MSDGMWPHQRRGVEAVFQAIKEGHRRIVLSSPTGGGKTRMACELIDHWVADGLSTAFYTRRRILTEQVTRVLNAAGIDFGVRAAEYEEDGFMPVQVCSVQTQHARRHKRSIFASERVLVDECHDCTGKSSRKIFDQHRQEGASIVGLSATPLGLGGMYDTLIQAGTNSELRACGALVPALHYAPDEPDMRQHKALHESKSPTEPQVRKAMRPQVLFGSVLNNLRLLNPNMRPTILFAAGVAESLWFAEQLTAAGIPSAHVDGQDVWVGGKFYRASASARQAVMEGSRDGSVRVVCNRFVLREGVDAPWLIHGIFATVFGSLQSYLQSGGRLLRNPHPLQPGAERQTVHGEPTGGNEGLECSVVTVQDHGGNWWRHGSLNADRTWRLEWTADIERGLREDRQRSGDAPQPGRCPACGLILTAPRCRLCGWEAKCWRKSRPVMQTDGTLKEMPGDVFRPRQVSRQPDGLQLWEKMYYRSRTEKGARTFRAAMALFAQENGWQWPDPSWPLMPTNELDFFRLVAEVSQENLTPKEVPHEEVPVQ